MKHTKKIALAIAVIACASILAYIISRLTTGGGSGEVFINPKNYYPVTYVIDGDTFKADVEGRTITIRLLGINTPEMLDPRKPAECFGKEASDETKTLLSKRKVRLDSNPNREKLDKYRRYLFYAYRDDGLFVNEFLVGNGFAREYTYGRAYSFQAQFKKLEETAKSKGKGMWAKGVCPNY